ncbi:polysaccharide lyase family 1 protein [Apiospora aurea]|uniref:Polysaccharide lyase family 1 protein n=1 Tax=Apiospora aurea TaxID=335848 RepID=A0ABR1PZZ8_9PEZI
MIRPISLLATLLATAISSSGVDAQAFPGAVGFGAVATGGAGGETYTVTTLADSGAGSFRDAVSKPNRVINFSVGGYIELASAVSLSSGLTINGQTAPGGGIGVMGAEVSGSGRNNLIIRNLRMRQGLRDAGGKKKSAINLGKAKNVILDHCSLAYGQWNSIDAVKVANLTVSNSIIALPIGQQFGAHVEGGPTTFHQNLWVSAHNRQPLAKGDTQFVNNVVYDFQSAYTAGNSGGTFRHDILNNYFIAGPSSTDPRKGVFFQMNDNQAVFAAGNMLDADKDGRLRARSRTPSTRPARSKGLASMSAADAYAYVVANAGAMPRDELDAFVVDSVKSLGTRGKIIKDQAATGLSNGGYGTIKD